MDAQTGNYPTWIGSEVVDRSGQKIGKITDIFYDDVTHRPEWLAVKTGLFGGNDTFIPIQGSNLDPEGRIMVGYDKDMVKDAPNVAEGDHMTPEEESNLWSFYGFDYKNQTSNFGYGQNYTGGRADQNFRYSRFDRASQGWGKEQEQGETVAEATTVNETVQQTPETVRLRKYRSTEMIPVTKEEVRVEGGTKQTSNR